MNAPVRIARIAAGGDGVGRLADGRVVFVPRTAPGDLIEVTDVRRHPRFARARVARLLEAGPDRVEPRCGHYVRDACGGCQLQHLTEPAQRAARRAIVGDALRRLGRIATEDPPLEPSATPWGYRTRIALAPDGRGSFGFHRLGEAGAVFPLERCEIAGEPLNVLWSGLRSVPVAWPRDIEQLVLRVARDGRCHLIVRAPAPPNRAAIEAIVGTGDVTLWWAPPSGAPRCLYGDADTPAGSFEQVHPAMGDRVRDWALDQTGDLAGRHAWDLYAGMGDTTRRLAARGATVESVEVDAEAVRAAESGPPTPGVRRRVGKVEDWVAHLKPPVLVVTNPPRAGMDPAVTRALASAAPAMILYLSCDPATLARDLARLPGYRLRGLQAFDLFPQTSHVETAVRLERE